MEQLLCKRFKAFVIIEKLDLDDKYDPFDLLRVNLIHKNMNTFIDSSLNIYKPIVEDTKQGGYSIQFCNQSKCPITLFQYVGQKSFRKKKIRFMVEGIKKDFTSSFRNISETYANILFEDDKSVSLSLTSSVRYGDKTVGLITFRIDLTNQQQSQQEANGQIKPSNTATLSNSTIPTTPETQTSSSLHTDPAVASIDRIVLSTNNKTSPVHNNKRPDQLLTQDSARSTTEGKDMEQQEETLMTKLDTLRLESQALEKQIDELSRKRDGLDASVKNFTNKAFPFLWEYDEDHIKCMNTSCNKPFTLTRRRFVFFSTMHILLV